MSRVKKKNKNNIILFAIICIALITVAFYMIQNQKKEPNINENVINTTNTSNQALNNNVEEKNEINETQNEGLENTINNETKQNTVSNTTQSFENSKPQESKPGNVGVTDKKQKAIELVKNNWGADDSVDFVFDYVNENGEYIIAVKDRNSATVKCYFRVDFETETVELD